MTYVINRSVKFTGLILFLLSSLALVSCGSSTGSENVGPPFVMSISPGNQTVTAGATIQFVVVMSGTDQSVNWSVTPAISAGTIDAFGVYTAPPPEVVTVAVPVTITATSAANPTRSISTILTVIPLPIYSKFSSAGNMPVARYGHTATQLPSGIVLVAGGIGSTVTTSITNAELYIPTATPPTYAATGFMREARAYHTATVLTNGKVLITGGFRTYTTAIASAELYDLSTGAFSATGSMKTARAHHTATILNNGKVLIAGGSSNAAGTALLIKTAELYDPVAGTFTLTNEMNVPRLLHTATLLKNGKVLIAGGTTNGTDSLASAEYYSPISIAPFGNFSSITPGMNSVHTRHAATRLRSGSVLLTGGVDAGGAALNTFDLYSTGIGAFVTTSGAMSIARADHTSTLLGDGRVLLTGGIDGTTFFNTIDLYSPSGVFLPIFANMSTVRANHAATPLYNGMVLITGGRNTNGAIRSYVIFK